MSSLLSSHSPSGVNKFWNRAMFESGRTSSRYGSSIQLKQAELVELTGPMQAHPAVRIESNRTEDPPMDGHLPTQIRQCCLGNVVRYSAAGVERAHVVCCCDEREKVDQT